MQKLLPALQQVYSASMNLSANNYAANITLDVLSENEHISIGNLKSENFSFREKLIFRDVCYGYDSENEVLSDINFESAFKLSILTLMNTVNSSIYGLNDFSFYNLPYLTKYCLILFMIIGRIELLTILLIFKKFFFKN